MEVRKPTVNKIHEQGKSTQSLSPSTQLVKLCLKKHQKVNFISDGYLGTTIIDKNHQLICVARNSTITIPEHTSKLKHQKPILVNQARHHNLPNGVSINSCYAKPKNRTIPIILINTRPENVWIKQQLLAAEIYQVDIHPLQYNTPMDQEGNTIKMRFQPISSVEIMA